MKVSRPEENSREEWARLTALCQLVPLFTNRRWFGLGPGGPNAEVVAGLLFHLYREHLQGRWLSKKEAMKAMGVEHLATAQKYVAFAAKLGAIRVERSKTDARVDLLILTEDGIKLIEAELDRALVDHDWVQANLESNLEQMERLKDRVTHVDPESPSAHLQGYTQARLMLARRLVIAKSYEAALKQLEAVRAYASGEDAAKMYDEEAYAYTALKNYDAALQAHTKRIELLKGLLDSGIENRRIEVKLGLAYLDRGTLFDEIGSREAAAKDLAEYERLLGSKGSDVARGPL